MLYFAVLCSVSSHSSIQAIKVGHAIRRVIIHSSGPAAIYHRLGDGDRSSPSGRCRTRPCWVVLRDQSDEVRDRGRVGSTDRALVSRSAEAEAEAAAGADLSPLSTPEHVYLSNVVIYPLRNRLLSLGWCFSANQCSMVSPIELFRVFTPRLRRKCKIISLSSCAAGVAVLGTASRLPFHFSTASSSAVFQSVV